MFSNSLILGKDFAQAHIPHLYFHGDTEKNGFSLKIVGRALYHNRTTAEQPLTIHVDHLGEPANFTLPEENHLVILQADEYLDDAKIQNILDLWDRKMCPEFQINEQMDAFQKRLRTDSEVPLFRYYVDAEHHRAVAVLASCEHNVSWIVQATLHQLTPWLFTDDRSEEEKTFVKNIWKSGGDAASDAYIRRIEDIYNLSFLWKMESMKQWADTMGSRRFDTAKRNLDEQQRRLERLQLEYSDAMRELTELQLVLNGARMAMRGSKDRSSELVKFFENTDSIEFVEVNDDRLTFRVYTDLAAWDEEAYRSVVAEENSYIWEDDDGDMRCDEEDIPDWNRLFDNIFLKDRFRIRVQAEFCLEIGTGSVHGNGCRGDANRETYINNPHIGGYSCMGQNTTYVTKALMEGNYVYAIEQCIHSASNFNFDDSTVGELMFSTLFGNTSKFLFDKQEGDIISVREALRRCCD